MRLNVRPTPRADFEPLQRRAKRVILHCGNTAALNGSILVVSNLRHDLSGMAIIEQLVADDVLDSAYEWIFRSVAHWHTLT
jgi:hypothetical protein